MKNLFLKSFLVLFIIALSLLVSCSFDIDADDPSTNVSNIVLPLDSSEEVSQSVSEDSSLTASSSSETTSSSSTSSTVSQTESTSSTSSIPETYDGDWNLILVNSQNLLPADFNVETEYIGNRPMDKRIISIVQKMISDAKADGVDLLICSSYRSVERQETLFAEQIQKFINQGYSSDAARTEASKWVAVPRTSEHHTGLALDIVTPTYQMLDFGFEETDAFKWLSTHCTEYGFILRYPKDKTDITGIVYEPWHYRYVGVDAAMYIHENGLTLEEYLEK